MLNLNNITLVCMSGLGYKTQENLLALEKSSKGINFYAKLHIELEEIKDIDSWNKAIIYELPKYIQSDYCLLVHHDGYVLNADLWNQEWLNYDYCASPWPLPTDEYSYRTPSGRIIRVGNSVSLRSKKLMDLVATRPMEYHYGNNNEDGQICVWERDWLEEQGCKFMPFEEAIYFGKEVELPENKGIKTFLFHTHG